MTTTITQGGLAALITSSAVSNNSRVLRESRRLETEHQLISRLTNHDILEREAEADVLKTLHKARLWRSDLELEFQGTDKFANYRKITAWRIKELEAIMLNHNWAYIYLLAEKYFEIGRKHLLTKLDLLSAGAQGFITALRRYNPETKNRILTYAHKYIKGAILNRLSKEKRFGDLQYHRSTLSKAYELYRDEAGLSQHQIIRDDEFAYKVGLHPSHFQLFLKELELGSQEPLSIDTPMQTGSSFTLTDTLAITTDDKLPGDQIYAALKTLKPKQREVIALRYGLALTGVKNEYGHYHTLEEVGTRLNLTKERVRQIEEAALDKLSSQTIESDEKYFWIPKEANLEEFQKFTQYLSQRQKLFNDDEFLRALLLRLSKDIVYYRGKSTPVLNNNELNIIQRRLGLVSGQNPSADKVADATKLTLEKINIIETRAIRRIYEFFRSKSGAELQGFFTGELSSSDLKTPDYDFDAVARQLRVYVASQALSPALQAQ